MDSIVFLGVYDFQGEITPLPGNIQMGFYENRGPPLYRFLTSRILV